MAPAHAQDAQQGQLRNALGHRQRLHREHEEAAGEQRHQRQHAEIDAIGLRQPGHAQRRLVRRGGSHVGAGVQCCHHGLLAPAGREPHVDARQRADAIEVGLRAGDVHHQQRRPFGGDAAADRERLRVAVTLQRDVVGSAQQRACGGVDVDQIGIERRQRRGRRGRCRSLRRARGGRRFRLHQPARRDPGGDQRVEAQQVRRMRLPVGAAQTDRQVDHRTRLRDARREREARVQILGQQAVARPHAEVGRAAGRMHRGLELRQRRRVDQLHREGQRDAQRDGQHGRGLPPRVMAPLGPQQPCEQRAHGQDGRTRGWGARGRGQGCSGRFGRSHPAINPAGRPARSGRFRRGNRPRCASTLVCRRSGSRGRAMPPSSTAPPYA